MTQEERLDYLVQKFKEDSDNYYDIETGAEIDEKRQALRALMNIRAPKPMDADVLKVQDEYLRERAAEKGMIDIADMEQKTDHIFLWQGDITRIKADVIVNAANSQMLGCFVPGHYCIDNAIHTFAGIQLRLECHEKMQELRQAHGQFYEQPTAVPLITDAYALPAKKVIHVAGPIVEGELTKQHEESLAACYKNSLELAAENGLKSIVFCCISTGVFAFPNQRAARIAVDTVQKWIKETGTDMKVIFNVYKDQDMEIYQRLLQ